MRRAIVLWAAAIALVGCGASRHDNVVSIAIPHDDIYPIYDAVLRMDAEQTRKLGIARKTTTETCTSAGTNGMTSQAAEAVENLRLRNKQPTMLEDRFHLPFPHVFVESLEQVGGARLPPPGKSFEEFLEEEQGKLQKQIDEGYSEVQLSLPGFSKDGATAAVYVAISFAGSGYILHRQADQWVVDPRQKFCEWIS